MVGGFKDVKTKDLYDKIDFLKKDKVDFTEALKVQIPQARELATKQNNLTLAVENLLALEKQTRQAGDAPATVEVALAVVEICREVGDWDALNSNITLLVKRRGQLKQVVTRIVQKGSEYVEETPNMDTKLKLIDTLRAVSEGKIHTELERARLTRTLAKIKEAEGNIAEAAEIMQEVQVETYGSMEREEKVDYILEQVRLCLDKGDFDRASIMSKKINTKQFEEGKLSALKLRFFKLLNQLHFQSNEYMELAKSFYAIFQTESVLADPEQWKPALRDVVLFLVMSPFTNEQSDMMARVAAEKKLDEIVEWKNLLHFFRQEEIVRWPLLAPQYLPLLASHTAFQGANKDAREKVLHTRLTQHNIRVLSKYYTRLRMSRLAALLDLDVDSAETHLCDMVSNKQVFAKIDRLEAVCTFAARKDPNDILNEWAHDIGELLGKLEKTCHLIHKEQMIHAESKKRGGAAAARA